MNETRCKHNMIASFCSICTGFKFKKIPKAEAEKLVRRVSPAKPQPARVCKEDDKFFPKNEEARKGPCVRCRKRKSCKELCKKAQKYVKQDHIWQREILIDPMPKEKMNTTLDMLYYFPRGLTRIAWHWPKVGTSTRWSYADQEFPFLSALANKAISLFHHQGLDYGMIAQKLCRKKSYIGILLYRSRLRIRHFTGKAKGGQRWAFQKKL